MTKTLQKMIVLVGGVLMAMVLLAPNMVLATYPPASLQVCVVIADTDGVISDGTGNPGNFLVPGTLPTSQDVIDIFLGGMTAIPSTSFSTPLHLNADVIGNDGINDAECVLYDPVALSNYFYYHEQISGSNWLEPLYYDSLFLQKGQSLTLNEFETFNEMLFNSDPTDNIFDGSNGLALRGYIDLYIPNVVEEFHPTLVVLNTYPAVHYQCSDGIDNDQDSKIDELDPGCWLDPQDPQTYNPTDDDESDEPVYACSDGIDNDGDGTIDMQDPGCTDPTDDSENEPPVITLIGDNPFIVLLNATFTDPGATASDPEEGDITSKIIVTGSVNTSATGTYPLLYEVSDLDGLTATTSRMVNVINPAVNQKPVITVLGANPFTVEQGDAFTDPGASADDLEDGDITASIVITGSVDTSVEGDYVISYNVVDSQSLAADQKTRTVHVVKKVVPPPVCTGNCGPPVIPPVYPPANQPPTITLVGSNPLIVMLNATFTDPGATATDPEDGNITNKIVTTGSVENSTVGDYQLVYKVEDSKGLTAATSRTVTVKKPDEPTPEPEPEPQVCTYLLEYLKINQENNPLEVIKLQSFLKNIEGFSALEVNGIFDQATYNAVKIFQTRYFADVLTPWGLQGPTGYVYITTKKKVNEIYCQKPFPLTVEQIQEVAQYKEWLESLSKLPAPQKPQDTDLGSKEVGVEDTSSKDTEVVVDTENTTTSTDLAVLDTETKDELEGLDDDSLVIDETGLVASISDNCPVCTISDEKSNTNLAVAGLNGLVHLDNRLLLFIIQAVMLVLLAIALALAIKAKQAQPVPNEGRIVFSG